MSTGFLFFERRKRGMVHGKGDLKASGRSGQTDATLQLWSLEVNHTGIFFQKGDSLGSLWITKTLRITAVFLFS